MRRIVGFSAVLGLVTMAACGGSVDVAAASGSGGAGAGTGAGAGAGATTSSTGTTGSSSATSSTSTGTTGAGGATPVCSSPQGKACTQPSDCAFAETNCCICGRPELSDLAAVNVSYATLCGCDGPVCDCASSPNPNLALSCDAGQCAGWDVRKEDALSACTKDSDCRLRAGLSCCETCDGAAWNLVAVRKDAEGALAARVCSGDQGCPACVPQYPSDVFVQCIYGQCQVVSAL
jgi:hypothetical protein